MNPMTPPVWSADEFESHRPHLTAVAYRMLGSVTDAEDAVQEAWLRLRRSGDDGIENLGGWLTTVVGRVCVDMLRSRRSRRESYVGTWLPEPVVGDESGGGDPAHEALLADSVGLALLVVLDTLSPAERLAFVLHDMFAVPFDEIAPIVERSPETARQLASRARRRIRGAGGQVGVAASETDRERQREVVAAFLAASRAGDFSALMEVLDPDVVFRADNGSRGDAARSRIEGADQVARYASVQGRRFAKWCHPATVNGSPGLVIRAPGGAGGVVGVTVRGGRITTIDLVLAPEKLGAVSTIVATTEEHEKFS
jgi:RNA polymerase sigma factor (sigma-70 family)